MAVRTKPIVFTLFLSAVAMTAVSAGPTSLFSLYGGKSVKVYVAGVEDSTQTHEVDPGMVKAALEEELKARKSIRFQVVDKPEDAELSVGTQLKGFMWTDHDPVDMLMGVGMAAMDAADIEDYASVEADVTVTDVRSKKILWQDRVRASITKKPMSRAESIPLVASGLAKEFIKGCFSKHSGPRPAEVR